MSSGGRSSLISTAGRRWPWPRRAAAACGASRATRSSGASSTRRASRRPAASSATRRWARPSRSSASGSAIRSPATARPPASVALERRLFFYEHAAVLGLEVAWDGSFELELGKVYTGLSWWSCVVLEGDAFTVHYPGWPDERAPPPSSRGGRERDVFLGGTRSWTGAACAGPCPRARGRPCGAATSSRSTAAARARRPRRIRGPRRDPRAAIFRHVRARLLAPSVRP